MKKRYSVPIFALLIACMGGMGAVSVDAATVKKQNIGELISLGEYILFGTVDRVTDGIDANGVPYTEVTVRVDEAAKGETGSTYTFRQFGLTKPRDMGNGVTNLNVTPDGWPTYSQGEEIVVFLYKAAAWTGLRTTVGLFQGKFTVRDGMVTNIVNNEGLFNGVRVDKSKLTDKELAMVDQPYGKVDLRTFKSFVNKAVAQQWFPEMEVDR